MENCSERTLCHSTLGKKAAPSDSAHTQSFTSLFWLRTARQLVMPMMLLHIQRDGIWPCGIHTSSSRIVLVTDTVGTMF